jgi:small subunit ribosomal protein S8e
MALWQGRSMRKSTGGRYHPLRKKRKYEIGAELQTTTIGDRRTKTVRGRGGGRRVRVLSENYANVTDPKSGKTVRAEIISVVENPANPNYVQRNIMTKGAIIKTSLGNAKISSRPGHDGAINAVLVE